MEIRRVREGEAQRLRELRLRALAQAPEAFTATAEGDAARDAAWWEALAASGRVVVAEEDGRWLGLAGGALLDDGDAELWGLWVDPAARGRALGARLVEAVAAWAREQGAVRLELQVADPEGPAARLYRALGFTDAARPAGGGCRLRLERAP